MHEIAIAVGRVTIGVRFSRVTAAAAFAERFVDARVHTAPDIVVYAVAADGAAYFWLSSSRVRRWPQDPSDELMVFFADNVAMNEYLVSSMDIGIHAAVLEKHSRVIALVGHSTAGKTTTALAATRIGFTLYSDDRCIIQDGFVVPFLRAITIREASRSLLLDTCDKGAPLDEKLSRLPAQGEASIRPRNLLGEQVGGPPRRLSAVFFIAGYQAKPNVQARSLYASLPDLLKSMVSRHSGIERAAYGLAGFRDLPMYRLQLGTPSATARAIERTLDEAIPPTDR